MERDAAELVSGYDTYTDAEELGAAAAVESPMTFTVITISVVSTVYTYALGC